MAGLVLEQQTNNIPSPVHGSRDALVEGYWFTPCFRCGVCCTRYRVHVNLLEARRIADALGIKWHIFLSTYVEPRWTGADSFFLRHQNGACIFLSRTSEPGNTVCLVHAIKPAACREWTPSLSRRECQEGLLKYWGLVVTPKGELYGTRERIQRFQLFLDSLMATGGV
jgi:hypothetical protein